MIWEPIHFPATDGLGAPEGGSERGAAHRFKLICQDRSEDHDRAGDACIAKLIPFGNSRHPKPPWIERLERSRNFGRAQAIGVGFDHREQRHTGMLRQRRGISLQGREIYLQPAPRRLAAAAGAR